MEVKMQRPKKRLTRRIKSNCWSAASGRLIPMDPAQRAILPHPDVAAVTKERILQRFRVRPFGLHIGVVVILAHLFLLLLLLVVMLQHRRMGILVDARFANRSSAVFGLK